MTTWRSRVTALSASLLLGAVLAPVALATVEPELEEWAGAEVPTQHVAEPDGIGADEPWYCLEAPALPQEAELTGGEAAEASSEPRAESEATADEATADEANAATEPEDEAGAGETVAAADPEAEADAEAGACPAEPDRDGGTMPEEAEADAETEAPEETASRLPAATEPVATPVPLETTAEAPPVEEGAPAAEPAADTPEPEPEPPARTLATAGPQRTAASVLVVAQQEEEEFEFGTEEGEEESPFGDDVFGDAAADATLPDTGLPLGLFALVGLLLTGAGAGVRRIG